MSYSLKIASPRGSQPTKSTYVGAGRGKREGRNIELKVTRFPVQNNIMYLYGPAGHLFPKHMRTKRILDLDGNVIGKAVVTEHQKALVLHLEVQTEAFIIEMIRAPRATA